MHVCKNCISSNGGLAVLVQCWDLLSFFPVNFSFFIFFFFVLKNVNGNYVLKPDVS